MKPDAKNTMNSTVTKPNANPIPILMVKAEDIIPHGFYCYTHSGPPSLGDKGATIPIQCCPYWKQLPGHPSQMNGWCEYMKTGDMVDGGTDLLWDQVKECGINCDDDCRSETDAS